MTADASLKPLLTFFITQRRKLERERDAALDEGKKWFRRIKVAEQAGQPELAEAARAKFVEARQAHDEVARKLDVLAMERDVMLSTTPRVDAEYEAIRRRTIHAMEEFRKIGIDPQFAGLDVSAVEAEADEALVRLRGRMEGGEA
jgi:molecular chaperone GrpE (heat shock protein)